jgi:hypothetical protein
LGGGRETEHSGKIHRRREGFDATNLMVRFGQQHFAGKEYELDIFFFCSATLIRVY